MSREALPVNRVLPVDALSGLRQLPAASVDCVLTSPPYWGCRDYATKPTRWADGDGVLGLEMSFRRYVAHLLEVMAELRRVLKPTGTLWVNLGDVFEARDRYRALAELQPGVRAAKTPSTGAQLPHEKSLCLVPHRFAIEMVDQGWVLRNHIVWAKPNHLPTSVKDRFACSWEHLFFFAKAGHYGFDLDAVRVPHRTQARTGSARPRPLRGSRSLMEHRGPPDAGDRSGYHPLGRNPGDVWSIATHSRSSEHPAAFPEEFCVRPILAGCPRGGVVLDPFMGSGTVAVVARRLQRRFIGFDANPRFVRLAEKRLAGLGQESGAKGGQNHDGFSHSVRSNGEGDGSSSLAA